VGYQFYHQWEMLTTDLHYARALLNPYLLGEVRLHNDIDVKETLICVLRKNTNNSTTYAQALKDFVDFIENQRPFSGTPPPQVNDFKFLPHEWWDLIGASGRTLAPITCHILAQV
jgi:hypothetical protein